MLGKKKWENCRRELLHQGLSLPRPSNPLEQHPRHGGDVKLHHLYYLKASAGGLGRLDRLIPGAPGTR